MSLVRFALVLVLPWWSFRVSHHYPLVQSDIAHLRDCMSALTFPRKYRRRSSAADIWIICCRIQTIWNLIQGHTIYRFLLAKCGCGSFYSRTFQKSCPSLRDAQSQLHQSKSELRVIPAKFPRRINHLIAHHIKSRGLKAHFPDPTYSGTTHPYLI